MSLKLFIASDHAGYELKEFLKNHFDTLQREVQDLGTFSDQSVDYPDFAEKLVEAVKEHRGSQGVLICGSGIGMSIAANRHKRIRAALCTNLELAKLSREHNDSNVLVLGARFTKPELASKIVEIWLNTNFQGGRHQRRIDRIDN
jgi:ribose 5-phosphate isomerase B